MRDNTVSIHLPSLAGFRWMAWAFSTSVFNLRQSGTSSGVGTGTFKPFIVPVCWASCFCWPRFWLTLLLSWSGRRSREAVQVMRHRFDDFWQHNATTNWAPKNMSICHCPKSVKPKPQVNWKRMKRVQWRCPGDGDSASWLRSHMHMRLQWQGRGRWERCTKGCTSRGQTAQPGMKWNDVNWNSMKFHFGRTQILLGSFAGPFQNYLLGSLFMLFSLSLLACIAKLIALSFGSSPAFPGPICVRVLEVNSWGRFPQAQLRVFVPSCFTSWFLILFSDAGLNGRNCSLAALIQKPSMNGGHFTEATQLHCCPRTTLVHLGIHCQAIRAKQACTATYGNIENYLK